MFVDDNYNYRSSSDKVVLSCSTDVCGLYFCTWSWTGPAITNGNVSLPPDENDLRRSTLTILSPSRSDNGVYTCTVTYDDIYGVTGFAESADTYLNIIGKYHYK